MRLKRFTAAFLALVTAISAAAGCARKKNGAETVPRMEILTGVYRGTVYPLPEGYSADSGGSAWYDPASDTVLCCASAYFESENGEDYEFKSSLLTLSPDGVKEEDVLDVGENGYVSAAVRAAGGVLLLVQTWDEQTGRQTASLIRHTADGDETVEDLARFFSSAQDRDWFNIGAMCADADGNIYLASDQEIAVLSPDMNLFRSIPCSSWISSMDASPDGRVYVSGWFDEAEGMGIAPLDLTAGTFGTPEKLPDNDAFFFGPDFDLYTVTKTGIVGLTKGENGYTSEVLMDFVNSNINPDDTSVIGVIDRDTFLLSEQTDPDSWTRSPAVYRHAEDVDLSKITVLELAYGDRSLGYSLPASVVAFNKTRDDVRIVVRDYSVYSAADDWEGGVTRLATDMATGTYCPDILVGRPENADFALLREKKLYADLSAFMDKDGEVNRSNVFGAVLSAFTDPSSGAVWGLCGDFSLQTLLSTKTLLGTYANRNGWSLGEFLDYAGSLPDGVTLCEGLTADSALTLLGGSYGAFYDREAGTCAFDTPDFVRWLEFLLSLPKNYEEYAVSSEIEKVDWDERYQFYHQGKIALKQEGFYDLADFIQLEMAFGTKEYVMIGFPAAGENNGGLQLGTDAAYAVTTRCEHPDTAWEALKSFCAGNSFYGRRGIPVLKSVYDEAAAEYETYEFMFYFDGSASWGTADPDNPAREEDLDRPGILTYFMKDDAERIKAILDRPAVLSGSPENEEITAIVTEEISALAGGISTPADCAKKIQSRVSIWLAENK